MATQLLAPPAAMQTRGIRLDFPPGFETRFRQLREQLPGLTSSIDFAAHVPPPAHDFGDI
jgi:hypothetical protein